MRPKEALCEQKNEKINEIISKFLLFSGKKYCNIPV
jgi:hypothetical protein